jgi:hypothetical protein
LQIRRRPAQATIIVVDVSPSAGDEGILKAKQTLADHRPTDGMIAFSNRAQWIPSIKDLQDDVGLRSRLHLPLYQDDPAEGGCALAAAIQLAGAKLADNGGKIVLVSDGLQTRGDAQAEAHRLADRGISISTVPIEVTRAGRPVVVVRSSALPAVARCGQTIQYRLQIESDSDRSVLLSLAVGHSPVANVARELSVGLNEINLPVALHETGTVSVSARCDRSVETTAAVYVASPTPVLLVADPSDTGAKPALQAMLGDSANVSAAAPNTLNSTAIGDAAAIILDDVPATALSSGIQQQLLKAAGHGTGLLFAGAARSFGPGGYTDSKLADALPVTPIQQLQEVDPSVAAVLIVDTSGSMYGQKLELCKEMCRLVISHLRPTDRVGVIEFFGGMRWAAPLQRVGDGKLFERVVNSFTAGGDNHLYPAIEEAGEALENVEARGKHILIMSDGDDEFAPFAALAQSLSEEGINISAAATMPNPGDRNVMPDVARWGGGRLYTVPDRFAIPDIKFKEPYPMPVSPLVLRSTEIVPGRDSLVRDVAATAWPTVDGYVRTSAKPSANVLLSTEDGSPILARWQFGAGQVAALTTQIGSTMAKHLDDSPAFSRLLAGLIRELSAQTPSQPMEISTQVRPAGVEVSLSWTGPSSTAPRDLHLSITGQSQRLLEQNLICVSPGRWDALFPSLPAGKYNIEANADGKTATGAFAFDAPRSFPRLSTDIDLLERLEKAGVSVEDQSNAAIIRRGRVFDLREELIPLTVLLLILYVAARRWPNVGEKKRGPAA